MATTMKQVMMSRAKNGDKDAGPQGDLLALDISANLSRFSWTRTRGRELLARVTIHFIVSELFHQQCRPWRRLVNEVVSLIFESSCQMIEMAIQYSVDEKTAEALLQLVIRPSMEAIRRTLSERWMKF